MKQLDYMQQGGNLWIFVESYFTPLVLYFLDFMLIPYLIVRTAFYIKHARKSVR